MSASPAPPPVKPRLRGVSHQWAAVGALVAGVALVLAAPSGRASLAAGIYAASMVTLFATSAIYHRVDWRSVRARRGMRHLDHAAIFVLIAGTYTPFALLVIDGWTGTAILVVVWAGALAGILRELAWSSAPRWLGIATYVALGWVAVLIAPRLVDALGWSVLGVLAGGVLYTAGAIVYARRRPDPWPTAFGYHEVFHALVIAAAAVQFAVVAFAVVPEG